MRTTLYAVIRFIAGLESLWMVVVALAITWYTQRRLSGSWSNPLIWTTGLLVFAATLAAARSVVWGFRKVPAPQLFTFLHHLLLAATIAATIVVLSFSAYAHLVDLVTNAMFSVVRIYRHDTSQQDRFGATEPSPAAPAPIVVLNLNSSVLRDAPREMEFPSLVAQLIEKVVVSEPRVVTLSFDVSPRVHAPDREALAQRALDAALDRAAVRSAIVLPLTGVQPQYSEDQKLVHEWARARCKAGVQLALFGPERLTTTVATYLPQYPSVGIVAHRLFGVQGSDGRHSQSQPAALDVCDMTSRADLSAAQFFRALSDLARREREDSRITNLNADFFLTTFDSYGPYFGRQKVDQGGLLITVPGDRILGVRPLPPEAAVFVSSGEDDYVTIGGRLTAGELEAAKFFSSVQPIKEPSHASAFVIDTMFGLVIGYLFTALWRRYNRAAQILEQTEFHDWRQVLRPYLQARMWLLIAVAALPAVLYLVFKSSALLLRNGWWLNPVPIVLGMFIDGLLASRRKHHVQPVTLSHIVKHHPDMILQIVLVASVVVYLLTGH